MSKPYPASNPFPFIGTVSVHTESSLDSGGRPVTPSLCIPAIVRLQTIVKSYLERYTPEQSGIGQTVVLRGDHGTGKTHTLVQVAKSANEGQLTPPGKVNPLQLYVKAETADMATVFRLLLRGVGLPELQRLARQYTGTVAGETLKNALPAAPKALRDDPSHAEFLLDNATIDRGAVREQQVAEIAKASGEDSGDFLRVAQYLRGELEMAEVAHRWLTGERTSELERKRLGVTGEIATAQAARAALRMITRLCHRAGRPLIISIDEYENLIYRDPALTVENSGWLRSLVEEAPDENAIIVLSGNIQAWAALPLDIQRRVPDTAIITLQSWSLRNAKQVIWLYLSRFETSDLEVPSDPDDDQLFPFNNDGVKHLLQFSSGNVRRFLQLCAAVFDRAMPKHQIVGGDLVKRVLRENSELYHSSESVTGAVERILVKRNLNFVRDFEYSGHRVDFAVVSGGVPLMLVDISAAIFFKDAAEKAVEQIKLIRTLQAGKLDVRLVLVVAGYVNPEVLDKIEPFVHDLVIFRTDSFEEQFATALDAMPKVEARTAPDNRAQSDLVDRIAAMQEKLEKLSLTYGEQEKQLHERQLQVAGKQKDDYADLIKAIKEKWAEERARIEGEIRKGREEREAVTWAEIEAERKAAVRSAQLKLAAAAALALVLGVGFLMESNSIANTIATLKREYSKVPADLTFRMQLMGVIGGYCATFALLFLFAGVFRFRTEAGRDLEATAPSLAALEAAARRFWTRWENPTAWMRLLRIYVPRLRWESQGRYLLRHKNPHFRFAGAQREPHRLEDAARFIQGEKFSILRARMFRTVAHMGGKEGGPLPEPFFDDVAEFPESLTCWNRATPQFREMFPPALVAIMDRDQWRLLGERKELEVAFEFGVSSLRREALRELSESRVREAAHALSPLVPGGYGTYDFLDRDLLRLIDKHYLFNRELLFYIERGASV